MTDTLVPARRRGVELLDAPNTDPAIALRSLADVGRCNRMFGGTSAVLSELRSELRAAHDERRPLNVLDVGTGLGDIPKCIRLAGRKMGVDVVTYGIELSHSLARAAQEADCLSVAANAMALPFASASVDVVTCSQVLHHFEEPEALRLLRELARVARRRVIVADIRRSWAAAAGLWLASWPLRFHPASRHDGVVSVLRGFRRDELAAIVEQATGRRPEARDRRGFRVTASWCTA